jgi:hypothetical protein
MATQNWRESDLMKDKNWMCWKLRFIFCCLLVLPASTEGSLLKIGVAEYRDKVYAQWLAQCVGNIYGLPHENRYIDDPGPDRFPLGYANPKGLRENNGAFSDDDTDFEYLYLRAMEKYGIEPTYSQLAADWKYHVRDRVWLANRAALAAMHYGFTPRATGLKKYNPHWFQIDPQLINEIWAVTSPGMVRYASAKSAWAAQIMDDDWGIEPTIHYGAMYSAAFFESDIRKLIEVGTSALPPHSRFAGTVEEMKALFRKYPDDWKSARREMALKYYQQEPLDTRTIWNANLNGACGILALLYGGGDFQRTLDLACVLGFDADNQAATISGLLGVIHGTKGIPRELLFPFPELNWKAPLNDLYKNVSRYDLPDGSLQEMAQRTAEQAEKIILKYGGKKVVENGKEYYLVNPEAKYDAPLELSIGPPPIMEIGNPVNYEFIASGGPFPFRWSIEAGAVPEGLQFKDGKLSGVPREVGISVVTLKASQGEKSSRQQFHLVVRGPNLAPAASRILVNASKTDVTWRDAMWLNVGRTLYSDSVEVIRDGKRYGDGSVFYNIEGHPNPKTDYYGYEWTSPQNIGLLSFHTGSMEECGGWFESLQAEYRDPAGNWKPVESLVVNPPFPAGNDLIHKAHFVEYLMTFAPVQTSAIRIIGPAGGIKPFSGKEAYFTSITELAVYPPLPSAPK